MCYNVPAKQLYLQPRTEAYVCCTVAKWIGGDRKKFAEALLEYRRQRRALLKKSYGKL